MSGIDVLVYGAANVDLIVRVPELPDAGATVFGSALEVRPGGKGLNQALGVARAGGRAALAVTVGADDWGRLLRQALQIAGFDISAMYLTPGARTGAALVLVPPHGDSAVILSPDPATRNDPGTVDRARALLADAPVTVLQLQLAGSVVVAAATAAGGRLIGTLVPDDELPAELWTRLDPIAVNAAEAAALLNLPAEAVTADVTRAAEALCKLGPRSAVVTAGAAGAAWSTGATTGIVRAEPVQVIDTTGAGDATLGALALALAHGYDLAESTAIGVAAGTAAVQRLGA